MSELRAARENYDRALQRVQQFPHGSRLATVLHCMEQCRVESARGHPPRSYNAHEVADALDAVKTAVAGLHRAVSSAAWCWRYWAA